MKISEKQSWVEMGSYTSFIHLFIYTSMTNFFLSKCLQVIFPHSLFFKPFVYRLTEEKQLAVEKGETSPYDMEMTT